MNIIERACAFCCGVMAEMSNLLEMSYQKVNVILFCWVEPGICLLLWFAFLWGCLHLPGTRAISWISLIISSLAILATASLLAISAVTLARHIEAGMSDPRAIFNMSEPHPLYLSKFNETVKDLTLTASKLGISYAAVNLLYYVLLLPIGIIAGYYGVVKELF